MSISAEIECDNQITSSRSGVAALLLAWTFATMSLWFFAFYNLPAEAPDWARRAQIACFGSNEMGLPGPAGWMLLTLSPGMFLGAIFIALYTEAADVVRRLFRSTRGKITATLLVVSVVTEAFWVTASIQQRIEIFSPIEDTLPSIALPEGYPRGDSDAPDFSLINQHGASLTLSSLRGRPVLLSFVFAHCQTVCPKLVTTILSATATLPKDSVNTVLITLDPWRDTPDALPQLAMKWALGPGETILSGNPDEVNRVLDSYNIPRQRDEKNGDVTHPSVVHVIDTQGKLAYSFNNPSIGWIRDSLARLGK